MRILFSIYQLQQVPQLSNDYQSSLKRTSLKYTHEVHEVKEDLKENLKLNLVNNGSTVKCKYCGCIRKTLEYNDRDSFLIFGQN